MKYTQKEVDTATDHLVETGDYPGWYKWPNEIDPCWDCGSKLTERHTPSCSFARDTDKRDLPEIPGTQWWAQSA